LLCSAEGAINGAGDAKVTCFAEGGWLREPAILCTWADGKDLDIR